MKKFNSMFKFHESDLELEDYLYALQQRNLVYNHDFRYFSNATYNSDASGPITFFGTPDGWVYQDKGPNGTINFNPETKQLEILKSSDDSTMLFSQALHEFPRWQQTLLGQVVSAKVCFSIITKGMVNITLSDGIGANTISKSAKGDYEVEVNLTINSNAEKLSLEMTCSVDFTRIRISKIYANVGEIALENLPCIVQGVIGERKQYIATQTPPVEELSLCEMPRELDENFSRLNSVLAGRFGLGENGRSKLIDMRGHFSRAWNNGADIDPDANNRTSPGNPDVKGDMVSTFQEDVFLKHAHGLNFTVSPTQIVQNGVTSNVGTTTTSSKTEVEADGEETRPKNIAELYTIKWA